MNPSGAEKGNPIINQEVTPVINNNELIRKSEKGPSLGEQSFNQGDKPSVNTSYQTQNSDTTKAPQAKNVSSAKGTNPVAAPQRIVEASASDKDVIESFWINESKKIFDNPDKSPSLKHDEYQNLSAEYKKKRYGKKVEN